MAGPNPSEQLNHQLLALTNEVRKLREHLEKLRLQQYIRILLSTRRLAWMGLMYGVLGGLGAVLGATLGLALLIWILSRLEVLPYIGKFVAEIVRIVKEQKP
jgi:hypothetical protein